MPIIEIIGVILSAIAGILALGISISKLRLKKKREYPYTIQTKYGKRYEIPANTSLKDLEKLIEILQRNRDVRIKTKKMKHYKEHGFVISEFFVYFVPGIIALLFVGTFVYLVVQNQGNPNYSTPKELGTAMTMIIGYFFGVGVSSAVNKGKTLTEEDVMRLVSSEPTGSQRP